MRRLCTRLVLLAVLWPAPAAAHPLDPLTPDELGVAAGIVRADSRLAQALFASITLNEPAKSEVLAWKPGHSISRQARAVAVVGQSVFEVVVDLVGRRRLSVVERRGVEPSIMASEFETVKIVLSNEAFLAALRKRGITDTAKLFCSPMAAGYFGIPAHEGKRLVKVNCYDTRRTTTNLWGWPIEGLYAMVDLRAKAVLSVADSGAVPIADVDQNFTEAAAGALRPARKPTVQSQPLGSNFTVDGHEIAWGNWRLHVRVDPRVGTILSLAQWIDKGTPRSVLYQGYLSEMFVPYMDPDYGWYSRTYFDTGEYGAGTLASPLQAGVDCPHTATFQPAVFSNDKGEPVTVENALCIFERSGGDPVWRHAEGLNGTYEGRAGVDLVIRMAAAIGNYDYFFDWRFNEAGEIEVALGATGIDGLKGVMTRNMKDATAAADTRYGTLVAPNLVAINHDHFFNFRLDIDVDGAANTFHQDVYKPVTLPSRSPRRSLYVVEPRIPSNERAAQVNIGHASSKLRVMNEGRSNAVGNAVSYEILLANHARQLLSRDDWPAKRAAFLQHDVWVTPYVAEERYAGGDYVLAGRGDSGLASWSERNRPIRDRDIVVWVNMGMHHLTRAEDLPVMPMIWHSFKLRPHNFFDRNPAIDLRNDTAAPGR